MSRIFKILIAEDELFQRLALLDFMELCSYEAVAVENGKKALEELRIHDGNFDLLLLDLQMPEMDGFELLTLMKQDKNFCNIPVIVMSAQNT